MLPSDLNEWPNYTTTQIPRDLLRLLEMVPNTEIDTEGFLTVSDKAGEFLGRVSLVPTDWNKERRSKSDLLYDDQDWGIVLHWFGDRENHNLDVKGYLEGFNGEQLVDGKKIRTSSHFIVGDGPVNLGEVAPADSLGVVQTQTPGPHGRPYVSSHLRPAPFESLSDPRNYFVRAMDEVLYFDPGAQSILQSLSQDTRLDPNMVTISIEIAGYKFDQVDKYPSSRKIANVVSVVWAIMKRYHIPAINILGHLEINTDKSDPGKKFLSLIRFLIGVKAMLSSEIEMKELVFSPFFQSSKNIDAAIQKYFRFVRDYLLLVSDPQTVYEWENETKYWFIHDVAAGIPVSQTKLLSNVQFPLGWLGSYKSLEEDEYPYQPGISILADALLGSNSVKLMAHGECVYRGIPKNSKWGKTVAFRHREANGAEIISMYANMEQFGNLEVGNQYKSGYILGEIESVKSYVQKPLRFSIAYAGAWDVDLSNTLDVPENAGRSWISSRFIDPREYIKRHTFTRIIDENRLQLKLGISES